MSENVAPGPAKVRQPVPGALKRARAAESCAPLRGPRTGPARMFAHAHERINAWRQQARQVLPALPAASCRRRAPSLPLPGGSLCLELQGGKAKAAKAPLAAANNGAKGKTIEETYQKLSQVLAGCCPWPPPRPLQFWHLP